jgi:hypothetical protein
MTHRRLLHLPCPLLARIFRIRLSSFVAVPLRLGERERRAGRRDRSLPEHGHAAPLQSERPAQQRRAGRSGRDERGHGVVDGESISYAAAPRAGWPRWRSARSLRVGRECEARRCGDDVLVESLTRSALGPRERWTPGDHRRAHPLREYRLLMVTLLWIASGAVGRARTVGRWHSTVAGPTAQVADDIRWRARSHRSTGPVLPSPTFTFPNGEPGGRGEPVSSDEIMGGRASVPHRPSLQQRHNQRFTNRRVRVRAVADNSSRGRLAS